LLIVTPLTTAALSPGVFFSAAQVKAGISVKVNTMIIFIARRIWEKFI
jgi:hypothetical protein